MHNTQNQTDAGFRNLIDRLDAGVARLDEALRHRYANPSYAQLIGRSTEQLLGRSADELGCDSAWCSALQKAAAQLRAEALEQAVHVDLPSAHGTRHLLLRLMPDRNAEGVFDGFLVEAVNVTPHRQAEDRARQHEALLRAFMDHSDLVAWLGDEHGRIAYGNRHWLATLGLEESQVIGRSLFDLFPEAAARELRDRELEALSGHEPHASLDARVLADGSTHWWQTTRFPFHDVGGQRFVGSIAIDATERVHHDQQIRKLAIVDPVTGLLNANGFQLLAGTELRRSRRRNSTCTLVLAEINNLPDLRARLGDGTVITIMRLCALLLRGVFRETDIVARIGDNRYAVLAGDSAGEVELLKRRLRRASHELDANPVLKAQIDCSMGVMLCEPDDDADLDTLLLRAEKLVQRERRRSIGQED